jgi:hypothetical protein
MIRCIDALGAPATSPPLARVIEVPVTETSTRIMVADFGA